ncbi:MAG: RNA polymerase sigma factor [Planctomycetaceae bacterium]|nr:RNA polymerase sigma factor [Planctomycetaceae bacterium]
MTEADSESGDDERLEAGDIGHSPLDPGTWTTWHRQFSTNVKSFLLSVLRNEHAAEEVFQATFSKALTHGGNVASGSEKAWLFRVAFNEAMMLRRKLSNKQKAKEQIAQLPQRHAPSPDQELLSWESVQAVRIALDELPAEQAEVVRQRMYENLTFQQIADSLGLPLGTVLTRMRLALIKLRQALSDRNDS